MIKIITGNVLNIERGIIAHGCNGHGIMGAGIALQIKNRFPDAFEAYRHSSLQLGSITVVEVDTDKFIVNAVTQKSTGVGKQVSYDAVEECFARVVRSYERMNGFQELTGIKTPTLPICFPMIGAGLGGGNWEVIKTIIDQTIPDTIEKVLYVL